MRNDTNPKVIISSPEGFDQELDIQQFGESYPLAVESKKAGKPSRRRKKLSKRAVIEESIFTGYNPEKDLADQLAEVLKVDKSTPIDESAASAAGSQEPSSTDSLNLKENSDNSESVVETPADLALKPLSELSKKVESLLDTGRYRLNGRAVEAAFSEFSKFEWDESAFLSDILTYFSDDSKSEKDFYSALVLGKNKLLSVLSQKAKNVSNNKTGKIISKSERSKSDRNNAIVKFNEEIIKLINELLEDKKKEIENPKKEKFSLPLFISDPVKEAEDLKSKLESLKFSIEKNKQKVNFYEINLFLESKDYTIKKKFLEKLGEESFIVRGTSPTNSIRQFNGYSKYNENHFRNKGGKNLSDHQIKSEKSVLENNLTKQKNGLKKLYKINEDKLAVLSKIYSAYTKNKKLESAILTLKEKGSLDFNTFLLLSDLIKEFDFSSLLNQLSQDEKTIFKDVISKVKTQSTKAKKAYDEILPVIVLKEHNRLCLSIEEKIYDFSKVDFTCGSEKMVDQLIDFVKTVDEANQFFLTHRNTLSSCQRVEGQHIEDFLNESRRLIKFHQRMIFEKLIDEKVASIQALLEDLEVKKKSFETNQEKKALSSQREKIENGFFHVKENFLEYEKALKLLKNKDNSFDCSYQDILAIDEVYQDKFLKFINLKFKIFNFKDSKTDGVLSSQSQKESISFLKSIIYVIKSWFFSYEEIGGSQIKEALQNSLVEEPKSISFNQEEIKLNESLDGLYKLFNEDQVKAFYTVLPAEEENKKDFGEALDGVITRLNEIDFSVVSDDYKEIKLIDQCKTQDKFVDFLNKLNQENFSDNLKKILIDINNIYSDNKILSSKNRIVLCQLLEKIIISICGEEQKNNNIDEISKFLLEEFCDPDDKVGMGKKGSREILKEFRENYNSFFDKIISDHDLAKRCFAGDDQKNDEKKQPNIEALEGDSFPTLKQYPSTAGLKFFDHREIKEPVVSRLVVDRTFPR